MLHEQDRGLVLLQHCLDLHSGDDVDVVHWLVPDVKVHGFADGTGQEDLFLLAGTQGGHVLLHLRLWHIQLRQHGEEEALVDAGLPCKVRELSPETRGVLIHLGDLQPVAQPHLSGGGDIFAAQ